MISPTIGPACLLTGAYLAVSPGFDIFLYPKLLCISFGAFICLLGGRPQPAKLRRYLFSIVTIALLSALLSASPLQSILGLYRSPTAGLLGILAAWMSYEAGRCSPTRSWRFILIGAAACSALALAQLHPSAPFHILVPGGRAIGTIGSPPYLGCMLALAIPIALLRFPAALFLIGPALAATQSKAALIGAAAGTYLYLMLSPAARKYRGLLLVSIAGPALTALFLISRSTSDVMRIYTWKMAWKAFLARPLLGWGPDNFIDAFMQLRGAGWIAATGSSVHGWKTVSENAHNSILNILATQGLLGFAARAALFVAVIRALYIRTRDAQDKESHVILASTAAIVAYSMFNPTPFMAWCVLAFILGSRGL